ncbi:voltage-gated chloride channel family protein [Bdellovibrio svalbardensis]|uniref:Voltage-gated chloride channel family protein n=1 Tax=Bdellovibrio svalbardensis TaxID=2972972 RepID=A0ABT6DJK4_9BACT|nr:voltage-gated chloride channel family protein [Bdellovibrio svalbardensis]MDG0816395.1 voltage-gated chloride channel family protein [Bdellovibrio svalbardensis]
MEGFIFSALVKRTPEQIRIFPEILKWLLIASVVGVLAGSASAGFLWALDFVTHFRLEHSWLLFLLPVAGMAIVFLYTKFGKNTSAGSNLLIDEIHNPKSVVPLRMVPLVLLGTLATHLFGGSAGREGTAVQMGGSLADQLTKVFKLDSEDRKLLLMAGISAGFSSVFGTPLAGAIFGLEVLAIGRMRYSALLPCFVAAIVADRICLAWGISHTHYSISQVPPLTAVNILWALVAGILFGLCAFLFSWSSHRATKIWNNILSSPYLQAFMGGILVIVLASILQTNRYLGLGIPVLLESFQQPLPPYDFILKLIFTVITLSAGFKGGEVTPLFFIGATLGNALAWLLPLPFTLLAGMGFVAVFAGAANTPLACTIMALELFGTTPGIYAALACVMSYLCSGHSGIYHSQRIEVRKYVEKN